MIRFFLLLSFVGCAAPTVARYDLKYLKDQPKSVSRKIPVSSRDEAKKVISNQLNFLKMLFTQSTDPYFGTPKWAEDCLKENKIGEVKEFAKGIQATSVLFLDANHSPGYCPKSQDSIHSFVVHVYCNSDPSVYEIKFPFRSVSLMQESLCH